MVFILGTIYRWIIFVEKSPLFIKKNPGIIRMKHKMYLHCILLLQLPFPSGFVHLKAFNVSFIL
jgi:hypothetical protein